MTEFRKCLSKGKTICIVGSSGVGKSTLVNTLLGDEWLWTGEVNEVTGKGRHTTVARELVLLKHGGLLIDNPGIREIQMWTDEHTLRESFADLTELAHECNLRIAATVKIPAAPSGKPWTRGSWTRSGT
ncbi:GTPase RsgA [Akkermansia muciniphila]|nr:GTPase RsgA [Akkermansia muciniphila]